MPISVSTSKSFHRFDDPVKPLITSSGLNGGGRLFLADQYAPSVGNGNYLFEPKNRLANPGRIRLLEVFGPTWTTSGDVSIVVETNGFERDGTGEGFDSGANTGILSGNCGIEGKPVLPSKTCWLSLQSGAVSYNFAAIGEIEHALVFGYTGIIYELGVQKKYFTWSVGDTGIILQDGGIVKYYLVKANTNEQILIYSSRSKLAAGAVVPSIGIYHSGGQMTNCYIWTGAEAETSIKLAGVLEDFQDWQNPASFESLAEKTMNKDKSEDFTYFGDDKNLMTLSISVGWDEKEKYEAFLGFFKYHDLSKEFICKDKARNIEFWAKFVSAFKDLPLGGEIFGMSADIRQIIDAPNLITG